MVGDVLVVNAGSTSLKLSLVDREERSTPVASLEAVPPNAVAVAHRIVHGGPRFRDPIVVDDTVEAELRGLIELAPLHNRPALAALDQARHEMPTLPHVAVFDTAFHATIPAEASTYPLPRQWREQWGIRRFGFHGLSVAWASERVPAARLVVCHLGGGCSVTAVREGRSLDTTMGYSPLDGVPMTTRSGALDPEILLHLLRTERLDVEELAQALEQESGLFGLSDVSGSVEELELSEQPSARLALAVFGHRVAAAIAAMAAALDGVDALVFTGGIGENSASVRADVCGRLRFLGVELDPDRNADSPPDAEIASEGSAVRVVVLHAREDVVAARAVRGLLA